MVGKLLGEPASGEKNNNTAGQLELKDLSWDNYNYVEENFSDNATALFGTKGVQLVIDGAKVTGVIAQDGDGNYLKINAKNGVVLAGRRLWRQQGNDGRSAAGHQASVHQG